MITGASNRTSYRDCRGAFGNSSEHAVSFDKNKCEIKHFKNFGYYKPHLPIPDRIPTAACLTYEDINEWYNILFPRRKKQNRCVALNYIF